MNMMNMKNINYLAQNLNRVAALILTGLTILFTAGCDVEDGTVKNVVQLPTDSTLNFYCEDEGIYTDDCVLSDPENPYANVAITAGGVYPGPPTDKFILSDAAPSAKARFYLWATALAKGAGIPGENQFYVAVFLQEVYAESGSPTTRDQAKKAYRSVLDNYYLNPTFFGPYTEDNVFIAVSLKNLVGENLYDPVPPLVSFYSDPVYALDEMSKWGYIYDTTNKIVTKFE
jgi:hypothetical protein